MLIKLSISEGATSTLLVSGTGQYAPGRPSDVQPNASRSSSGGSCCNATFQIQASNWTCFNTLSLKASVVGGSYFSFGRMLASFRPVRDTHAL